ADFPWNTQYWWNKGTYQSLIFNENGSLAQSIRTKKYPKVFISSEPYDVFQKKSQKSSRGIMRFRWPPGEESDGDLADIIKLCAEENVLEILNNNEILSTEVFGPDIVPPIGETTFYHLSGSSRSMQRCIENKGYLCKGYCHDYGKRRISSQSVKWNLEECLADVYTDEEVDECYVRDKIRKHLMKNGLPNSNLTGTSRECGNEQGVNRAYLAHNVWVRYKDRQSSINYKDGKLLTAGTEVIDIRLIDSLSGEIVFTVKETCEEIRLNFVYPKHREKTIIDWYKQLFTNKTFEQITTGLNKKELEAIKTGRLVKGISKNAVLIAYGYPPEDRTPDHNVNNFWVYWPNNNFIQVIGFDENGYLSKIYSNYKDYPGRFTGYYPINIVKVIRGDTFTGQNLVFGEHGLFKQRFKLFGVITPGLNEPFGEEARKYAIDLLQKKNQEVYKWSGIIKVGDEILNQTLIKKGYAKVSPNCNSKKYCGEYLQLEREARAKGVGLWENYKEEEETDLPDTAPFF
ncbi:MAG: thermonuclease family protein, partial [Desulfobacteraceae bacterium]|nr:thermonuclease family protein [Desulfobacteraceae bacterium]